MDARTARAAGVLARGGRARLVAERGVRRTGIGWSWPTLAPRAGVAWRRAVGTARVCIRPGARDSTRPVALRSARVRCALVGHQCAAAL